MNQNNKPLVKNIDYIINDNGDLVFTAHYHLKRGYCCQSACLNCPYGFVQKTNPDIPAEFNDAWLSENFTSLDDYSEDDEDL